MGHTLRMTFKRTPGAKELGINLLDANPTIWWNTLNNSSANDDELSVFDHFVRLAFKRLISTYLWNQTYLLDLESSISFHDPFPKNKPLKDLNPIPCEESRVL